VIGDHALQKDNPWFGLHPPSVGGPFFLPVLLHLFKMNLEFEVIGTGEGDLEKNREA
jgi:hypothetical protein